MSTMKRFLVRASVCLCWVSSAPAFAATPTRVVDPAETLRQALANPLAVTALDLRGCGGLSDLDLGIDNPPVADDEPVGGGVGGFTYSKRRPAFLRAYAPPPCRLRSLPAEMAKLVNLTELDLSGNWLTSLPKELGELRQLKKLSLARNGFDHLPAALLPLEGLEELSLRQNLLLRELSPDIGRLVGLKKLDIAQTFIKVLPDALGKLVRLEELDAFATDLRSFPEVLGLLPALRVLDLSGTRVDGFTIKKTMHLPSSLMILKANHSGASPTWMYDLPRLRHLRRLEVGFTSCNGSGVARMQRSLPGVEIVANDYDNLFFPRDLRDPEWVAEITLDGLRLSALPAELKQFVNLREIFLNNNAFTEVPPMLFEFRRLLGISLNHNQIASLPEKTASMRKLVGIDLEGNQLTAFPDVLLELPDMKHLQLASNRISTMPRDLTQLAKLRELTLGGNRLTRAEITKLKRYLPTATAMAMSASSEEEEDASVFTWNEAVADPERVTVLDLSSHKLKALPPEITRLKNLELLHLENNPIAELPSELGTLKALQVVYAYDTLLDADDARKLQRLLPKVKVMLTRPTEH